MDIDVETRHLILGVHLFAGLGFLSLAALGFVGGQAGPAVFRAVIGLLVVGLGVTLYRIRS